MIMSCNSFQCIHIKYSSNKEDFKKGYAYDETFEDDPIFQNKSLEQLRENFLKATGIDDKTISDISCYEYCSDTEPNEFWETKIETDNSVLYTYTHICYYSSLRLTTLAGIQLFLDANDISDMKAEEIEEICLTWGPL